MIHNEEEPKYEKDCQALILANDADAASVVVVGGKKTRAFRFRLKTRKRPAA